MFRAKYGKKSRRPAKKTGAKKLSKPLRKAMTQVAKKVVARAGENKIIGVLPEQDVLHNSAIGSADCEPVVMEIAQGTDSRSRVGDRITPKTLTVKGVLSLNQSSVSADVQDIYARVLILSQKDIKSGASILSGAVDANELLKAGFGGGAVAVPFSGNTSEIMYPINTDLFRVYMDRVIKFTLIDVAEGNDANPHYSARWSYTFTKKNLPVALTFDDGNGNWPNNFAPFVAIGYAYSDGTGPDSVSTKLISNVFAQLHYEDM